MTFPNGKSYIGTGNLISNDTVLTAGHYIYSKSDGGWVTKVAVYPGYNGSIAPFGVAYAKQMMSVSWWTTSTSYEYDIGAIKLGSTGGSSGSGVYNNNRQILAVHAYGNSSNNFGTRINSDKFNIVYKWAFNKSYIDLSEYYTNNPVKVITLVDNNYYNNIVDSTVGAKVPKGTILDVTGIEYMKSGYPRLKLSNGRYFIANKAIVQKNNEDVF